MLYTSLSRRRRCICKRIQTSRALLFSFFDLLCLSQCCSASAVFFIPVVNTPAANAVVTQICFCRTTSFMIFVFTKTAFCTYRDIRAYLIAVFFRPLCCSGVRHHMWCMGIRETPVLCAVKAKASSTNQCRRCRVPPACSLQRCYRPRRQRKR